MYLLMALMNEAHFAFARGDDSEGLLLLRKSFGLAREGGHLFAPFDNPAVTIELCEKALEAGIEVEYVREIIGRRGLIPGTPPVHIENWPWSVKIYTLGRFRIVQESRPTTSKTMTQRTPLLLLKALIVWGGMEVDKDRLTNLLWPDAEGDVAYRSFVTTVHRLRKLLGDPDALTLTNGKLTLDNRHCWVDVWAFERIIGLSDECMRQKETEAARKFMKRALALYRGRFLDGEQEAPWMVSPAERLRGKFLKGASWLGRYLEGAQAWDDAALHYEQCLGADDCTEDTYRRLMVCYDRLGRKGEALAVYERCRKTLSSVLGTNPSAVTEALRASLAEKAS